MQVRLYRLTVEATTCPAVMIEFEYLSGGNVSTHYNKKKPLADAPSRCSLNLPQQLRVPTLHRPTNKKDLSLVMSGSIFRLGQDASQVSCNTNGGSGVDGDGGGSGRGGGRRWRRRKEGRKTTATAGLWRQKSGGQCGVAAGRPAALRFPAKITCKTYRIGRGLRTN
jgi:hypothetical protein